MLAKCSIPQLADRLLAKYFVLVFGVCFKKPICRDDNGLEVITQKIKKVSIINH